MKLFLLCLLVVALNTTSFNEDDTFSLEDRDNSACVIIREENNGEFSRNPCSITKIADKQWQVNMTYTSLSSGAIANRVIDWLNFTDQYGKNIGRNVSVETLSNSHAQGQIIKNNHIVALGKSEYSYNNLYDYTARLCYYHCVPDPIFIMNCTCDIKSMLTVRFQMNTTQNQLRVDGVDQDFDKREQMVQLFD